MRYVCQAAAVAISIFVSSSVMSGQDNPTAASKLSITNYQFVSQQPVTLTQWQETYRADLVNTGGPLASVGATLTSLNTLSFSTVPGENTLNFSLVPATSQTTSQNTFTILVDRTVAFNFNNLQWTFSTTPANPIANAGPDQTTVAGATVSLNGSASTDPSGLGTLTYSWVFASRPAGSAASLTNPTSVMPSFVVDVPGNYVITLTVSNGTGSGSSSVTISTISSPPVANAGPNQSVPVGATVILNGTASSDVDGKPLTYQWTMVTRPAASTSALSGATTALPTFIADTPGTYFVQLIVTDATLNSNPSSVTITTFNSPPVANAGANQLVQMGALVQLNGSGSTDVNGNPLTYSWTLITLPPNSAAVLRNPSAVNPTFTADIPGTYVAQLIVNDGLFNSAPVAVTITTNMLLSPTVNAGPNQTVADGTTVTLNGSASDPQKFPLTLFWSLITKPNGSKATLSSTSIANPTFVADSPGTYVAQLIANDGYLSSLPSTVTISTTDTPPVANAGPSQNVTVGMTVTLDGTGSSDAIHAPLTYSWSILTSPSGSAATLSSATAAQPTFVADLAGAYVVQLIVNDGFVNSNPATVLITAVLDPAVTLTPNPLLLSINAQGTLSVLLTAPAGPNGQIVNLSSSNTGVATVPMNVTVGAGATGANALVTPVAVGSTTITASASGFAFGTATVNVSKPVITVTLDFTTVGLTHTMNGSVALNAPAPPTGVTVTLSSSPGGIVDVEPKSLTITSGNTTGSFTVTGLAVGSTTITAGSPGYVTGSASVNVGNLGAIILPATATVNANQSVPLQISLATGAPVGGATITLTSSDPSKATVPATVFIPQLATTPATQPQLTGVNFGSVTITASSPGFIGAKETVTVTSGLSFSPSSLTIAKNDTKNLTLNLSSPAPTGLVVNLSSDNQAVATVPATVSFPTGATSVSVPVTGVATGTTTIHASALPNLADTTASVTVVTLGAIIVPLNTNAPLNQPVTFAISLTGQAPTATTVTLGSSDATKVTISPSTVIISAGQTTPAVQPQVTGVNFGSATITASASGFATGCGTVLVTASLSFVPPTLTINGVATQNLTLTLSTPAPNGGVTVNLSSSNTSVATVPTTVTISNGLTSVSVPVTSIAPGTATIHASALPNLADTTATVTVVGLGSIGLPSNLSLAPGHSAPIAVSLSGPAGAGGVTVSLNSSDITKVTVSPAIVFIAAGQTKPATQPQVTGVNFGSANINATAPGYTPGSSAVQVTATLSFSPTTATITGTATQNFTLNLSVPAPSGGVVINLSSSNTSVATVPATVTFASGTISVTVPVTGVGGGSATIHASALPGLADTTAGVTVTQPKDITLPTGVTVGPGQSANFPVTLTHAAPSGGVFVTLTSSSTSIATLNTANVFIPQGATTSVAIPKVIGVTFGSVTITATAFGLVGDSKTVQVTATLSYFPATISISGTSTQKVALILSASAPAGGLTVNLSSDNPSVATVPPTVNFAAGASSVTVPVTGVSGGSTTIHASALPNVPDTTASVTVTAPGAINLPSNITVGPSQSAPFPVTLGTPAPPGGVNVALVSSDITKVTVSPGTVAISAGQTVPAVQAQVTGVNLGSANINATAPGYTSASQLVTVGAIIVFAPATASITGTATQNLMLNLSAPAPAGLTFSLVSSNTGVATVPTSVAFATGATSVTVPVTGAGSGTATITASTTAPNIASTTASITDGAAAPASITINAGATQSTQVGKAFASTLGVTVKDSGGHVIPNSPVTFTAATGANGQSGTFSNSSNTITVNTTSAGVANAGVFTANTKTGNYTVTVTAGPAPPATFNLTNIAGPATQMTANTGTTPQSAQVSKALGTPLGVTVKDADNNPVQGVVVTFSAPAETGPSGTFANSTGTTQATTDANGVATATVFTANAHAGGQYNVSAKATGLTTVNFALTNTNGPPNQMTPNSGTAPQSAQVTKAFGTLLGVTIKDATNNPIPGIAVTFTAPAQSGPSGTFANGTGTTQATTDSNGVATATVFTANTHSGGAYNVTASANGLTSVNFALTNTPGPATQMTVNTGTTPQSAQASKPYATLLGVTIKDADNNPVQGVVVTFTAPAQTGPSGTFANTTGTTQATTDTNGVATATVFTANSQAGPQYKVTASASGLTTVDFALTNTSGPPNQMTTNSGTTPQSARVSKAFGTLLGVTIKDATNNPIPGIAVTFTAPAQSGPSGTFANGTGTTQATTDSNGVATATVFTANTHAGGHYNVSANASGLSTVNFVLTNTPGPATQLAANAGTTPQSAKVSTAFGTLLAVTVQDASNNPVPGILVTFTAPAQTGASGTFANSTGTTQATTDANGVSTATVFTANTHSGGPYNVSATASGLTTVNFALTNLPGTATQMAANAGTTPQSAQVTKAFGALLGVTVKDATNNPIQGTVVTFAAPAQSGPSGTFANSTGTTQATTDANGVATATVFTANSHAGAQYNVTASATGLTSVNFALTNKPGPATQMAANAGTTPQSASISTAFGTLLGVTVKDASTNPVQGTVVTFTAPAQSGPSGTFANGTGTTQATTDANGVATATVFTANSHAGAQYNVTGSASGLTTVDFALTNTNGPPTQMTANTGTTPQSAQVTKAFGTLLGVTVKDASNNPIPGLVVTFAAPAQTVASGTFANSTGTTQATTDANGVATATVFTANKIAGGPYKVSATATGLTTVNFALTNTPGPATQMAANAGTTPQSASISAAFGTLLGVTVKDALNNPVQGTVMTFTAPAQTGASGTFANGTGTTQATTNANGVATATVFTANTLIGGPYNVSATATGLTAVKFALTNTPGPPASIVATSGTPQTAAPGSPFAAPFVVTVTDGSGNPVAGITVTFAAPPQSGASGTFAGGLNTATTNSAGVATSQQFTANGNSGSYTVTASVNGLATKASFSLTNGVASLGALVVTGASLGQNLQTTITVSLPQASPSPVSVTLTSGDPTKLLFNDPTQQNPTNASASLTVKIPATTTSVSVIIQSPGGSTGSVTVTAAAAGYTSGGASISVTPSGFVLAGPNGNGNSFTVNQGTITTLTVSAARLDSSFNFVEIQPVRLGATINVSVTSSATNVGTILLSPVVFTGGNDSAIAQFTASSTMSGATTVTAGVPSGFSAPRVAGAAANSVFVTVNPVGIVAGNVTVADGLEANTSITLNGVAPAAGLPITITSNSTNLKLSTTPTGAGQSSIVVTVPPGDSHSPAFYVYGGTNTGSATYTANSSLGNSTGTVTFAPSAIVIAGPSQVPGGNGFLTTTGAPPTTIFLFSVQVDGSGNIVSQQAVAGGAGVSVTVTSTDIAPAVGVGSISPATVTIAGGATSATTSFIPKSAGSANITTSVPAGFSAPAASLRSVEATVVVAGIACTTGVTIGHNLEVQGSCSLGQFPPASGVDVKLTGSSGLLLAVNPTDTGSSSITIHVPSTSSSFTYYLQAIGTAGTAPLYTATASGYSQGSGTVTIAPSAAVILGPFAFSQFAGFPVPVTAGSTADFTVAIGMLDSSGNLVTQQALAGGLSVVVNLTDSNTAAGTIAPTSPVTVPGGSSGVNVVFTAATNGSGLSTTIAVSGATANPPYGSVTFNVN